MRDGNGVHIAIGRIVVGEGKPGGIEMVEARINAFLVTDGQGQFAKQLVTAISVRLIKRAAELKAVEHLRADALAKQQIERFVGKKLRR